MIDFWKRKQYKLQFEWDTVDFEKNLETIRPEFELKVKRKRRNPVTGLLEPYLPLRDKIVKYALSYAGVLFMVCLALALFVGIIIYRVVLNAVLNAKTSRFLGSTIVSITSALINLIIIVLLSQFYSWLAVKLTDFEYRRTDTEYENSLTIKMYLFQFVNFYSSIFYIAFFKGR